MATIDIEELQIDVLDISRDDLLAALDAQAKDILGMSGDDFMALIRHGETPNDPAAEPLAVLARALIDTE